MNSTASQTDRPAHRAHGTESASPRHTFQWLVILGFPTNLAAAQAMPELFTADAADEARSPETAFAARLLADRARVGMRWCA
jgi:hypothetical protein